MICRHAPGDRNCSSRYPESPRETRETREPKTPDKRNFSIEEFQRIGPHIILKVKYPNCSACSYEGNKVMVFLSVTELQAMKWKEIDPHFRNPKVGGLPSQAPSPAARFPANPEGWADAVEYAKSKVPNLRT